jgi:hypothetical protein
MPPLSVPSAPTFPVDGFTTGATRFLLKTPAQARIRTSVNNRPKLAQTIRWRRFPGVLSKSQKRSFEGGSLMTAMVVYYDALTYFWLQKCLVQWRFTPCNENLCKFLAESFAAPKLWEEGGLYIHTWTQIRNENVFNGNIIGFLLNTQNVSSTRLAFSSGYATAQSCKCAESWIFFPFTRNFGVTERHGTHQSACLVDTTCSTRRHLADGRKRRTANSASFKLAVPVKQYSALIFS